MLYLSGGAKCSSATECAGVCQRRPQSCNAPTDNVVSKDEGLWSDDTRNNPFAEYFKESKNKCSRSFHIYFILINI
jgi:hypothetical protein